MKVKTQGDAVFMTVNDVCKALNISADSVRRWEKQGLIKGKRNENNYRIFDTEEVSRIQSKLSGISCNENNYKILKNNKSHDIQVIDLFSGAGGTALGFKNAGLKHKLLVEIDKDASQKLKNNF